VSTCLKGYIRRAGLCERGQVVIKYFVAVFGIFAESAFSEKYKSIIPKLYNSTTNSVQKDFCPAKPNFLQLGTPRHIVPSFKKGLPTKKAFLLPQGKRGSGLLRKIQQGVVFD